MLKLKFLIQICGEKKQTKNSIFPKESWKFMDKKETKSLITYVQKGYGIKINLWSTDTRLLVLMIFKVEKLTKSIGERLINVIKCQGNHINVKKYNNNLCL